MAGKKDEPSTRALSLAQIMFYSASGLPVAALSIALFVYLPNYFASHLAVPLTVVGASWALVRMLDLGVDPVIAIAMDRTRTLLGRYRAWMIGGAPVFVLGTFMLFMAPKGIGSLYLVFWLLVLYLGISVLYLSQSAWAASLAPTYDERSRLFGILGAAGVVASVAVLFIPIVGKALGASDAIGVRAMGWFVILLTPLAIGIAVWRTPERVTADHSANHVAVSEYVALLTKPELLRLVVAQFSLTLGPGWMSALYLFYFKARGFPAQTATGLLILYILAGVAGAIITGRVAMKTDKHRTLMATTTAYSLGLCFVAAIPNGNVLAAAPIMLWCGFMASGFDLMIRAMTADVGDEIRLAQGKERTGLLYALIALSAKVAAALAIGLTYPLLARVGFNPAESGHNSSSAIAGLQWLFLAGPIVFVMLGGACVIGWRLDAKRHATVRAALDARDARLIAQYDEAPIAESIAARPAAGVLADEGHPDAKPAVSPAPASPFAGR